MIEKLRIQRNCDIVDKLIEVGFELLEPSYRQCRHDKIVVLRWKRAVLVVRTQEEERKTRAKFRNEVLDEEDVCLVPGHFKQRVCGGKLDICGDMQGICSDKMLVEKVRFGDLQRTPAPPKSFPSEWSRACDTALP